MDGDVAQLTCLRCGEPAGDAEERTVLVESSNEGQATLAINHAHLCSTCAAHVKQWWESLH